MWVIALIGGLEQGIFFLVLGYFFSGLSKKDFDIFAIEQLYMTHSQSKKKLFE
jgi:hypothetical protein